MEQDWRTEICVNAVKVSLKTFVSLLNLMKQVQKQNETAGRTEKNRDKNSKNNGNHNIYVKEQTFSENVTKAQNYNTMSPWFPLVQTMLWHKRNDCQHL